MKDGLIDCLENCRWWHQFDSFSGRRSHRHI